MNGSNVKFEKFSCTFDMTKSLNASYEEV